MVSGSPAVAALDDVLSETDRSPTEDGNLLRPHLFTSRLTRRSPERSAMLVDSCAHARPGTLKPHSISNKTNQMNELMNEIIGISLGANLLSFRCLREKLSIEVSNNIVC